MRDGQRWGERHNNKSSEGGGNFTDDESKRFALCERRIDGSHQNALQTLSKPESEHHGDTQAGIITLFVPLCVHET